MNEYVDVAIIENGKVIGLFKALNKTKEKTEKIDDLKNRISMAIKDPVLQQGFEIICREYTDLEKENTELKLELAKKADTNHSLIEQMADLESEIAELQERYDKVDIIGYDALKNLTKAKELLNEFMRISKASDEDFEHDYSELIGETEQFIKDLEK